MSQIRKKKIAQKKDAEQEEVHAADHEKTRETVAHSDELLEDIDELLSELGTETAINFRQKGGE